MRGINTVTILGHLGHDPLIRTTPSGRKVSDLRIATNRAIKTSEGWRDDTEWHKVQLWGSQAEVAGRFLRKGSSLAIQGHLRTDHWTDEQNLNRTKTYVVCDHLHLLGTRPEGLPDAAEAAEAPEATTTDAPVEI